MRTKETKENQNDDISKLYEEVAHKVSEIRRASGLSHWELADKLGVPVCYTEILENGILVQKDGKRFLRWRGCPFEKEELLKISKQLPNRIAPNPCARAIDSETVFFCPVTINSAAIFDELQGLAKCQDITAYLTRQVVGWFTLKYRLFYRQFCLRHGRKNAELLKQRLLSTLAKYEAQA